LEGKIKTRSFLGQNDLHGGRSMYRVSREEEFVRWMGWGGLYFGFFCPSRHWRERWGKKKICSSRESSIHENNMT
jgi:hypothetical protein